MEITGLGWQTDSHTGPDTVFDSPEAWRTFLVQHIDEGTPVMVDWVDWGGHWQVVIGVDDCGTDSGWDDVMIFADPYDVTDQYQDGYYTFPQGRFFSMWKEGSGDGVQAVLSQEERKNAFVQKHELSLRETQVLNLIREGASNGEISAKLFISENTVKFHVRNILKKTGCANCTELLAAMNQL